MTTRYGSSSKVSFSLDPLSPDWDSSIRMWSCNRQKFVFKHEQKGLFILFERHLLFILVALFIVNYLTLSVVNSFFNRFLILTITFSRNLIYIVCFLGTLQSSGFVPLKVRSILYFHTFSSKPPYCPRDLKLSVE